MLPCLPHMWRQQQGQDKVPPQISPVETAGTEQSPHHLRQSSPRRLIGDHLTTAPTAAVEARTSGPAKPGEPLSRVTGGSLWRTRGYGPEECRIGRTVGMRRAMRMALRGTEREMGVVGEEHQDTRSKIRRRRPHPPSRQGKSRWTRNEDVHGHKFDFEDPC